MKEQNCWDILVNGIVEEDEEGEITFEAEGLKQLALAKLPYNEPDIDMILAIIVSAGKERDYTYLTSALFYSDCSMIGLNPSNVRRIILKIWSKEGRYE